MSRLNAWLLFLRGQGSQVVPTTTAWDVCLTQVELPPVYASHCACYRPVGTASIVNLGLVTSAGRTPPLLLSGGGCCAGYLVHCGFNGRGWGGMAGDKEVAHDPA